MKRQISVSAVRAVPGLVALAIGVPAAWLVGCSGEGANPGGAATVTPLPSLTVPTPGDTGALAAGLHGRACTDHGAVRTTLAHNDLPRNALTAESLAVSKPLLDYIAANKLVQASLAPSAIPPQVAAVLNNLETRTLLTYITSCALDACEALDLTWRDPQGALQKQVFHGELGLCAGSSPYGNWASAPPTQDCREVVSACVLARVNAHEKRVVLSARDPKKVLQVLPKVPVEVSYRDGLGSPVSLLDCGSGTSSPDCGWQARYVGKCTAGKVSLKLDAAASPSSVDVRVCKGIYGCDSSGAPPAYAGPVSGFSRAAGADTMELDCPQEGLSSGYFSVMVKSTSGSPTSADVASATCAGGGCVYPATESQVFTYDEGTFYGDLFAAGSTSTASGGTIDGCPREIARDMLAGSLYACYSDVWSNGFAHFADRLCAGPNSPCFVTPPGKCSEAAVACPTANCHSGGCESVSDPLLPAQPLRKDCEGTDNPPKTWANTITVYLNHPCDISRDGDTCAKMLAVDDKVAPAATIAPAVKTKSVELAH